LGSGIGRIASGALTAGAHAPDKNSVIIAQKKSICFFIVSLNRLNIMDKDSLFVKRIRKKIFHFNINQLVSGVFIFWESLFDVCERGGLT
jgi:hypothetical protein